MRSLLLLTLLSLTLTLFGQNVDAQFSENGWYLNPSGTIRILVIYAEIEYDKNPKRDPQPNGSDHWKKGQLPTWKDNVFDPQPSKLPTAMVSRYYHDISLGQYVVLGDYINEIITIKESEHRSVNNLSKVAVIEANKHGELRTKHNLKPSDFDMWKDTKKPGFVKESGSDDPYRYDHVMVIARNSSLRHGQGSTDPGSPGPLFGYNTDTQSRFGAMNGLPFEILKHEYNHLLLGGNNFHSGGGNASQFQSFFTCQQGGWSMMGSANSSFLTMSGWDRFRLGWKAADSNYLIRAWTADGKQVSGDLDPLNGDTGVYILNDLVTKGDMLRIKIPYLPDDEFQQWLWIENHQGYYKNDSPTDRYHWDNGTPCILKTAPGLYMQMQVDREEKRGANIYRGYADYLRPVLANGNHDMRQSEEKKDKTCPFMHSSNIFDINKPNPLSGNVEQELPLYDRNGDGKLNRSEHYVPLVRRENGIITGETILFGKPEHGFRSGGKTKIGMGTNPTASNMLTLVRSGNRYVKGTGKPNNRTVYLNGISVEIIDQANTKTRTVGGRIAIRVRANDTRITADVRWASDSIVLPPIAGYKGYALYLNDGKSIEIDRSETPTRNEEAEVYDGETYWNSPTVFVLDSNSKTWIGKKADLSLKRGSTLVIKRGAQLELREGAKLNICSDCTVIMEPGARIVLSEKSKVNCKGSVDDQGMELFQFCKGELVTQGDKQAFECR